MTRAELIQYITDNVYPNARNEVTAPMVRDSLLEIVDFLGDAATYNIGMVASGNQGLVTGGNVNTAIALALLPYYTAQETGQAIDDAIARIGLGQAAYKNIGQVAENNTDLVTGGQVYTAINTALTSAIKFQGISDTPLTDGSTTNPIQINGQSYTAKKGDMVVYGGNEFLWVGNKWQQMGDESSYALKTIQITGTGYLTGGGDLTQSRTLDISATAKGYIDHGEAAYNYFPGGVLDSTHLPSMYIGTTSVQFTAVAQNLTGISSVRATSNVLTLFEWDVTNSAWHFHGNIYTDGWFSGGGISPGGGGGGGGIDPVAMWRLLTNDPSLTQYDDYTKISADHINFPVTSVVGLGGNVTAQQIAQALNLGSFAYKNSLSVSDIPDLSGTYLPLTGGTMSNTTLVTNLNADLLDGLHSTDFFRQLNVGADGAGIGFIINASGSTSVWPSAWGVALQWAQNYAYAPASGENHGQWYTQLYSATENQGLYVRTSTNGANWYSWDRIITIGCWSSYIGISSAPVGYATHDANGNVIASTYLPLTGGTMSGTITSDQSYVWKSSNSSAYLAYDSGSVYIKAGYLYLETPNLRSLRNNETYTIYDSGNTNKSDVAWACSTLTAANGIRYNSDDATLTIYRVYNSGTAYGYETAAIQTCFDGEDPTTSSYTTWYPERCVLSLQPRGGRVAIGQSYANYDLDVAGSIRAISQLVSTVATGTAPLSVASTTNVSNLNADLLDGLHGYNFMMEYGQTYSATSGNRIFGIIPNDGSGLGNTYGVLMQFGYNLQTGSPGTNGVWVVQLANDHNTNCLWYRNRINDAGWSDWYKLWSTRNSGTSSYDWACNNLNAAGVIYATTGIYTDGWFSGGGVASSSDRRLKKNIKNFAYTPKLLLAIRPREWDWKDGSAMVGHAAGFVAQEIEPIMPYAVDGTRNFKALFYDRFHALEIAGLQDHERRIVELERAVKERDKKIAKLEKMLKLN